MSKYVGRIITDQAPAGYSVFFNGTNSFLNLAVQSFTGDFTVEAWVYPTRLSDSGGSGQIFSYDVINIQFATDSAGNLNYYNNSISTSATAAISLNSWQHVALCRSGSTTRIFVNGTLRATNASDSGTRAFSAIGQFASGGAYLFQGYISNVRWAATALYTANFTPPTQLLRIANTNLLTCNSPAIVDQSSNAFAITTNGNAAVSTFTPFTAYNPAPTSSNPLTPAPGVWTLDEALQYTQQGVWPSPAANAIEDVFSTYLYTGNGSTQTITNNIDLSGKGGLVWIKNRNNSRVHQLLDTVRGVWNALDSASTGASSADGSGLTAFNNNGFTIGSSGPYNFNTETFASWTFREQAKFFDVVTYTGNNASNRAISHNLGSTPGFILVKATSTTGDWYALHRVGNSGSWGVGTLNSTGTFSAPNPSFWGNGTTFTAPTSTTFTVSADGGSLTNGSGITFVAYLFAHDAGGFGPAGTDNVISCGSFDATSGSATVTLGWEPQWLLVKPYSAAGYGWSLVDNMRGMPVGSATFRVQANSSGAEASMGAPTFIPNATGFTVSGWAESNIYIAIRRGPMRPPTTGTSVLGLGLQTSWTSGQVIAGPPVVDLAWAKQTTNTNPMRIYDRLRGAFGSTTLCLYPNTTDAEANENYWVLDQQNGIRLNATIGTITYMNWMFRRAPGFFDVVCYTGNGSARTITHNLTIPPEFIIVKKRSAAGDYWQVYHIGIGNSNRIFLNSNDAASAASSWNNTTPTASVFSLGTSGAVNASGATFVAYLFATVPGVSKVGSYTGTGALQTINCGFTSGARFVLIKRTDSTGGWYLYDSTRGITSGNDPYLLMNSDVADVTGTNYVDTVSTGFQVTAAAPADLNASGGTYIFLAIA